MKTLILAATATFALLSPPPDACAQTATKQVPLTRTNTAGKLVRPAVRVPASLRPSNVARASTAQTAAARINKPGLKTLPDFPVTTRDGLVVSSQTLAQKAHWLLIYRRDNCIPCDRLMNVLAAGSSVEPNQGQSYVIVVDSKEKGGLDKVRATYSSLANASWVADKNAVAIKALKAHGAPILYGMEGANIKWMVPGNLGKPANVDHMAATWVAGSVVVPSPSLTSTTTTGK